MHESSRTIIKDLVHRQHLPLLLAPSMLDTRAAILMTQLENATSHNARNLQLRLEHFHLIEQSASILYGAALMQLKPSEDDSHLWTDCVTFTRNTVSFYTDTYTLTQLQANLKSEQRTGKKKQPRPAASPLNSPEDIIPRLYEHAPFLKNMSHLLAHPVVSHLLTRLPEQPAESVLTLHLTILNGLEKAAYVLYGGYLSLTDQPDVQGHALDHCVAHVFDLFNLEELSTITDPQEFARRVLN